MFKRANKITALLVAAASIMSVVPAMASERLGTKDGTLNYGIAFDGGKYIFDGYRTDDDDTGIYYNGGDKDKLVEDLEDFNIDGVNSKYGSKYVLALDNTDEYLVDLSTGKIVDDETDEEKRDAIQGRLRSTLKKTDRYEKTTAFDDVSVEDRLFTENNQFGDVWYMYSAKGDSAYTAETTTSAVAAKVTVTLPTAGTILDYANGEEVTIAGETYTYKTAAPVPANNEFTTLSDLDTLVKDDVSTWLTANVTTGLQGDDDDVAVTFTYKTIAPSTSVVFEVDKVNAKDVALTSDDISAIKDKYGKTSVKNYQEGTVDGQAINYVGFVNEDGKYIDASNLANISAYSTEAGKVVKIEQYNDYNKDNEIIVNLESIKAIAQDKDYIYAVTGVKIGEGSTEANAKTDADTASTRYFYQKIAKAQGDKKDDAYIPKTVDSYEIDNKSSYDDGDSNDAYTAILKDDDGYEVENNLYTVKDGTLYVVRVKSNKVKVFKMKTKKAKVDSVVSGVTKKLDAPLLQKDGDGDHDIFDGAGSNAVSLDVDGNVWALDKGAIYKADGTSFKEVYTLDRSINNLDVYNDGSLIAWEDGGDVYTTVTEGKAVTGTEAAPVTPATVGWSQLADGSWNFYDATGTKVANNWANVGGTWYYLKADGVMATGWANVGGTWYYLASSGAMKTGWVNDNGTWYYLASSGAMKTGWVNDNGTWYYLNGSGAMLANTTVDGYVLNASGAWVK